MKFKKGQSGNPAGRPKEKTLKEFDFKSHMFRHAIIDRMKARNDIPTRLAESITGHSSGGSEFNRPCRLYA